MDLPQNLKAFLRQKEKEKKKKKQGKGLSVIFKINEIKSQAMVRNDQRTKSPHGRKAVIIHDSLKLKKKIQQRLISEK